MEIFALLPNLCSETGHDLIYHLCFAEAAKKLKLNYTPIISKNASFNSFPREWEKLFSKKKGPFLTLIRRFFEFRAVFKKKQRTTFFMESFDGIELIAYSLSSFFFSNNNQQHWLLFRNDFKDNRIKEKILWLFIKLLKNCTFFSDSQSVAAYFKGHLLPIPHTEYVKEKPHENDLVCWWPGSPRPEKGLKEIQVLLSQKKGQILLTEECGGTLKKHLSRDEYIKCLETCDLVLLPYDPISYRARTSGIFVEAIFAGKIPVVKAGSWLARELTSFNLEELIVNWENPHFFADLSSVIKRDEFQKKMKYMVDAYRQFHSVEGLVKTLESVICKMV